MDIITEYLVKSGMNRRDLARLAGVTPMVITDLQKKRKRSRNPTLKKIADVMGVETLRLYQEYCLPQERGDSYDTTTA